jgi:ribosomal protein S6
MVLGWANPSKSMAKNQDVEMEAETELENEADVRVYELGFHLDPELPTEGVKAAYGAVRDLISSKGTIIAEGEPQMIQLAYTISRQETAGRRDFNSAYFCWIAYETTALPHADVLAAVNANKNMVRFIDLVTTKEAARHAVEIREFLVKAPERPTEDAEAVADVELDAALQSAAL